MSKIELPIDSGTWDPMEEDMVSLDFIEFYSEEEPYRDRSVVGKKIICLIEYATNKFLPLIIVYSKHQFLHFTSSTTGGVTASFGMLGDIIIAEPNAYIAFAGKRVIEQTLNKTVPEGSQAAEYLFQKGFIRSNHTT
ncbi:hypothetical protein RJ640_000957 [Escallonia rubra]|uniref:CoA carboxyltransferase N-terminal domain-containing protein n=1 Tax=Escallonia rubra TaxID=112253 RepID=A0AA88RH12_9ASTE|nr:hypothetical protein RJ640_000957 [Escallonia rubra]